MSERRRLSRNHLFYYFRVFDRSDNNLVGFMVDLSPEGLKIISESEVRVGHTYYLRLNPPLEIYGKELLEFDAECMWCRKNTDPDYFNAGFRLFNVSNENIELIQRLVDDFRLEEEK